MNRPTSPMALTFAAVALATAACGAVDDAGDPGDEGLVREIEVELGVWDPATSTFSPFEGSGAHDMPIFRGFQGLTLLTFAVRSAEPLPPSMTVSAAFSDLDGSVAIGQQIDGQAYFEPRGATEWVFPSMQVFLTPPEPAAWDGRVLDLEVEVSGGSRHALERARVRLVDAGCQMTSQGFECP
jgi:hypothetical protein